MIIFFLLLLLLYIRFLRIEQFSFVFEHWTHIDRVDKWKVKRQLQFVVVVVIINIVPIVISKQNGNFKILVKYHSIYEI